MRSAVARAGMERETDSQGGERASNAGREPLPEGTGPERNIAGATGNADNSAKQGEVDHGHDEGNGQPEPGERDRHEIRAARGDLDEP